MITHFVVTLDVEDDETASDDELKYMFMQSADGFEFDESNIIVHVRRDDEDDVDED